MQTRKRFGQHFLHDPAVIARIVAAARIQPGDPVVEIGPGPGTLTEGLLQAAGRLDVIEIDRDLAAQLQTRFGAHPGFVLHVGDALEIDWADLAARADGKRLRIVGNLPYNISTPLLFALLGAAGSIRDMLFMLQKEVVQRILAAPGSEHYGRLTAMLAPRVHAEHVLDVGAGAFKPPPRVASAVVRLTVQETVPPWALSPWYARVVTAAFGQRRKTLRNSIRGLLDATAIEATGIDPAVRAETLTPAQFGTLAMAAATHVTEGNPP